MERLHEESGKHLAKLKKDNIKMSLAFHSRKACQRNGNTFVNRSVLDFVH